jgi:hypothetical protein
MRSHSGPMVRIIMAGLLGRSLICRGIIVAKSLQLRKVNRESEALVVTAMGLAAAIPAETKFGLRASSFHFTSIISDGISSIVLLRFNP